MEADMSDDAKKRVYLPRWREDFPIRWDEDHYVTRRELTKFLTLGSAILVGSNAALTVFAHTRTERAFTPKRIASVNALAAGESLLFRYPTEDDPCILIRTHPGVLVAFSQVCTHLSCAVVYRRSDDKLFCPCHNGVFECGEGKTGAHPIEGPPERPLPRVLLDVRGDDVFATGVAS
jgi:nitrite reductase/ring-hydroxylating ferredoxin subunit